MDNQEIDRIIGVAQKIRKTERSQAKAILSGKTLHAQFKFDETILSNMNTNSGY